LLDIEVPLPELQEAEALANVNRAKIASARLVYQSAEEQARARKYKLLPEMNLVGGYVHIEGEVMAPPDSTFIGMYAKWSLFEGGASYYEHRAGNSRRMAAKRIKKQ
jgi:outer membrane protein TolC